MHGEIIAEQRRPPPQRNQQSEKDLYKILGVSEKADKKQIRKAYRELSKKYHPDKYKGKDLTEDQIMAKMQDINEAYETLSNDENRQDYDEQRSGGG
ncbi:DnaJ-like chaperone JEM1, partial [Lucilia cuprina]